ncbi:hypothetical protein N9361_03760 [Alphaproteobacteria bacterium]|nr:hypothetical protein [Alphaproteobacteria bacterium]
MQSLCHRFVVCFTIIIWSFGVAAAQHNAPPQNHNIKAAENAAICAAFAKIMGCKPACTPKPRNNGMAASIMLPIRCATLPSKMAVKILISKIST